MDLNVKVCFITAIYGNYEASCKKFTKQTIETDFICFTDNPNINSNGWIIDTNPYHFLNKSKLDTDDKVNSIKNNKHTFNIAKYYKTAFQNIPILSNYDIIVWVDGTIEIIYPQTSEYLLNKMNNDNKIIGWHHEHRGGILKKEVDDSEFFYRYSSTFWNNQSQPYQDVRKQYNSYISDGYSETFFKETFFKEINDKSAHFGIWITCFVAFLNKDESVSDFLNQWFKQILNYTTQDQISFPYIVQKTKIIPYTLPDLEITGNCPHNETQFYKKHNHGI